MALLAMASACGIGAAPDATRSSSAALTFVAALPDAPPYFARRRLPSCDPAEPFVVPGRWLMRDPSAPDMIVVLQDGHPLCIETGDVVAAWIAAECSTIPGLRGQQAPPCDDPVPVDPPAPDDDPVPVRTAAQRDRRADDPVPVLGPDDFQN